MPLQRKDTKYEFRQTVHFLCAMQYKCFFHPYCLEKKSVKAKPEARLTVSHQQQKKQAKFSDRKNRVRLKILKYPRTYLANFLFCPWNVNTAANKPRLMNLCNFLSHSSNLRELNLLKKGVPGQKRFYHRNKKIITAELFPEIFA